MTDGKHVDDSLGRLRTEIAGLDGTDAKARQRLEALVQEVEQRMADPKRASPDGSLGERLKTSTLDFEASHPRISALVNEVLEMLSSMGI
jgi:hypothetical protein